MSTAHPNGRSTVHLQGTSDLAAVAPCPLLADMLGGWEIVLIVAVVLILFGAGQLPGLAAGLRHGLREFRKATQEVREDLDLNPKESGLVYEALTHDNRTAEFVYPHNSHLAEVLRALILFLAQGFGIGRIPFAPGTFGSLLGLVWSVALVAIGRYELYLLGALGGVGLSVWLCGAAERILRQKDPPSVVLDEMVAVPFCFLPWVTHVWWPQHHMPAIQTFFTARGLLAASGIFVLFRLLDFAKPWPVKQSQHLPGGWGVTADDLLAAGYVALLVAGAVTLGWLR